MANNAKLDSITKARTTYAMAKTSLEAKLRDRLKDELANLQTQIDIAVRYAYDSGESKASILRAMGTKDYHTLNASLERTLGIAEVVGEEPLDKVYHYHRPLGSEVGTLTVTYESHGPASITGTAYFEVREMDDGATWFMARDPLWNQDYTVRNEAVAALDGRQDGFYYEEAVGWWKRSS